MKQPNIFKGVGIAAAAILIMHTVPLRSQTTRPLGAPANYTSLLAKYVTVGADGLNRVHYGKWQAAKLDRESLADIIRKMEAQKPSAMPKNSAFAYWANLYNAVTLKVILDGYPVASIRDIKSTGTGLLDLKAYIGPWRTKHVKVEGRELSLDDIEHGIMRPTFKDPRVHYAVNCASIGCPNLLTKAWDGATLDADLNAAAKAFVNSPRGAVISDGKFKVSSIYHWFEEDFGGNQKGVIAHLSKYASPDLAGKLKGRARYDSHGYDWTLNDAK